MGLKEWHGGRSWGDWPGELEKDCGCPKAPCGFILLDSATCSEHRMAAGKSMRHVHEADSCAELMRRRSARRNRPGIERAMDIVTEWEGSLVAEETPGWIFSKVDELQALLQKELNG